MIGLLLSAISPVARASESLQNLYDKPVLHPAIPLYDENNEHVLKSGKPYSPKNSCGEGGSGCHDYQAITHAYHFDMGRNEAADDYGAKRGTHLGKKLCDEGKLPEKLCKKGAALPNFRGLPQLSSPGYFGGYNCMGGNNPLWLAKKANGSPDLFADYGAPGLVQQCAACHPGGGWSEKDRNGQRYDETDTAKVPVLDGDYYNRGSDVHNAAADAGSVSLWDWNKSGVVEADCMLCHIDFQAMKKFPESGLGLNEGAEGSSDAQSHWSVLRNAKLIKAGFFRYADSSIFEFINLKPEDPNAPPLLTFKRQPAAAEPVSPDPYSRTALPNYELLLDGAGQPQLQWNKSAFDGLEKVSIPMLRFPQSEACMVCHYTSEARRGFYGFGPEAKVERVDPNDPTSARIPDFKDDVHKGTVWTEPNNGPDGGKRSIENCNACHARAYYKPEYANPALNLDHNFLKGNADNDVRNDLDYGPGTKSCEWCHMDGPNPIIPSKQPTLTDAHRERWVAKGYMKGQDRKSNALVKFHFNLIACQSCHTKGLQAEGKPLQILYRYREDEHGRSKSIPYKPALRYYWQDKASGHVLAQWERDSVFAGRTGNDGKAYGVIIDPISKAELGQVPASLESAGQYRFNEPDSEPGYRGLKQAYDHLLEAKGFAKPDTTLVWTESNEYLITHNTLPAAEAVPCVDCHNASGGIYTRALVRIYGDANSYLITQLPNKKLVDDGIVTLALPYMKVDDSGRVTENVTDIFKATKDDGFMSALRNNRSRSAQGYFRLAAWEESIASIDAPDSVQQALANALGRGDMLLFNANVGDASIRGAAVMMRSDDYLARLLSQYRLGLDVKDLSALNGRRLKKKKPGAIVAKDVNTYYSLTLLDEQNRPLNFFPGGDALVKLPYFGKMSEVRHVHVVASENGVDWQMLPAADILALKPGEGKYLLFKTSKPLSQFVITDKKVKRKKT